MAVTRQGPRPLAEQAADQLIDYITTQNLAPGDRLPREQDLCGILGVGRSTVREAIKRLSSRNILTVRQGAGTFIAQQTGVAEDPLGLIFEKDKGRLVWDLLEIRLLIEPEFAKSAALKATPEQGRELSRLCDEIDRQIRAGENYLENDLAFHTLLARCTPNTVLPKLLPIINAAVMLFTDMTGMSLKQETMDTHRQISEAVLRRDPQAAYDGMMMHVLYNRVKLRELGYDPERLNKK